MGVQDGGKLFYSWSWVLSMYVVDEKIEEKKHGAPFVYRTDSIEHHNSPPGRIERLNLGFLEINFDDMVLGWLLWLSLLLILVVKKVKFLIYRWWVRYALG